MEKNNTAMNIQIRQCYMYELMREQTVNFIINLFVTLSESNNTDDSSLARNIKMRMDQLYGPPWHCFVGKGFGSSVTYKNKHFLYMYIANRAIMLYKH